MGGGICCSNYGFVLDPASFDHTRAASVRTTENNLGPSNSSRSHQRTKSGAGGSTNISGSTKQLNMLHICIQMSRHELGTFASNRCQLLSEPNVYKITMSSWPRDLIVFLIKVQPVPKMNHRPFFVGGFGLKRIGKWGSNNQVGRKRMHIPLEKNHMEHKTKKNICICLPPHESQHVTAAPLLLENVQNSCTSSNQLIYDSGDLENHTNPLHIVWNSKRFPEPS